MGSIYNIAKLSKIAETNKVCNH